MSRVVVVSSAAAASVLAAVTAGAVAYAAAAPPAPPALVVQKARLLAPAQLAVDGTIACKAGSNFSVSVDVTELRTGQDGVKTSNTAQGPCSGDGPQAWTVTVTGTGGTFVPVLTTHGTITDPATQQSTTNADQSGVTITKS